MNVTVLVVSDEEVVLGASRACRWPIARADVLVIGQVDRAVEHVKGVPPLGLVPMTRVEFVAMFRMSEQARPLAVDTALKGFLEATASPGAIPLDRNLTRVLATRSAQ